MSSSLGAPSAHYPPGLRSALTGPERAAYPSATVTVILPGAGHWIQQERPREVNEALIAFLRGVD